jgi:hypothetical protein
LSFDSTWRSFISPWILLSAIITEASIGSIDVFTEGYPENPQGQVNDLVWFPPHITLQPQVSHNHFVVFAPQHAGWYNFTMKVHIDPVGNGVATEKTIPVIGSTN